MMFSRVNNSRNLRQQYIEPEFTMDNKYHRPKYNYSGYLSKSDLKFILNCAMKTDSIDKLDIALIGLTYTHPNTYHRLVQWSIYNRDNLTIREYTKLLRINALFYLWLYDMPKTKIMSEAMKCRYSRPPADCGQLAILVPNGVNHSQLRGKLTTKRQLTKNRSKKYKKRKRKKK